MARTCSTSDVPMPNASAPKAPWVEVWLSPQTISLARLGEAELGPDHVDDALAARPRPVQLDRRTPRSSRASASSCARASVVGDRPRQRRDVVIHRRDGQLGPAHRAVRRAGGPRRPAATSPRARGGGRRRAASGSPGSSRTTWRSQIFSNIVGGMAWKITCGPFATRSDPTCTSSASRNAPELAPPPCGSRRRPAIRESPERLTSTMSRPRSKGCLQAPATAAVDEDDRGDPSLRAAHPVPMLVGDEMPPVAVPEEIRVEMRQEAYVRTLDPRAGKLVDARAEHCCLRALDVDRGQLVLGASPDRARLAQRHAGPRGEVRRGGRAERLEVAPQEVRLGVLLRHVIVAGHPSVGTHEGRLAVPRGAVAHHPACGREVEEVDDGVRQRRRRGRRRPSPGFPTLRHG